MAAGGGVLPVDGQNPGPGTYQIQIAGDGRQGRDGEGGINVAGHAGGETNVGTRGVGRAIRRGQSITQRALDAGKAATVSSAIRVVCSVGDDLVVGLDGARVYAPALE